jgi:HlyD family secretion protein
MVVRIGRRMLVWIAVGLAAVLGIVALLRPSPAAVETAIVRRGSLQVTIDEEGVTRLVRRFVVSAPVAGRVLRIEALPGRPVTAGQTLATITPARPTPLDERARAGAEARVRAAEAELERARSEWRRLVVEADQATRDAERNDVLFKTGSTSRESAEAAQARARSAAEAVNAAEAAISTAEFALAAARAALISDTDRAAAAAVLIRSPIDGVVLRRIQESESVVAPGAALIEIGDLRDLEIVADLLSADAVRVQPGAAVTITRWGGARDLAGRVRRVEPSGFTKVSALGVEEQRVNVVVEFVEPPSERQSLGDGFRVEVRIVVHERSGVRLVPTPALFRVEGQWAVFVIVNDRLVERLVRLGGQNEQSAEVLEGLNEGDRVVIYPGESLTPGARVVLQ